MTIKAHVHSTNKVLEAPDADVDEVLLNVACANAKHPTSKEVERMRVLKHKLMRGDNINAGGFTIWKE